MRRWRISITRRPKYDFIEEEEEEEFPPFEYEPDQVEWSPVWDDDDNYVLEPIAHKRHNQ